MHPEAFTFCYGAAAIVPTPLQVVEFGSAAWTGTTRSTMPDVPWHGLDLVAGPEVDEVADAATWEPHNGVHRPDCIVCTEVLEHHLQPYRLIDHAARILLPGGWLIVTCAGPERAPHEGTEGGELPEGEHYANIYPHELKSWLDRNYRQHVLVHNRALGDLYALAQL